MKTGPNRYSVVRLVTLLDSERLNELDALLSGVKNSIISVFTERGHSGKYQLELSLKALTDGGNLHVNEES